MNPAHTFDVAFFDSCLGGSTVARRLARGRRGLQAFFLADYAINPLGVKTEADIEGVLARWLAAARSLSDTVVIACNTASVLYEAARSRLAPAATGLRVWTMLDLVDRVLQSGTGLAGARVCLMGTPFTVSRRTYHDRLGRAGAREIIPLAAPVTEHAVALLRHESAEGRRAIEAEIGRVIRACDAVLLACTCFPLVAEQVAAMNPSCRLVDPAAGIDDLLPARTSGAPNHLTLHLTGATLSSWTAARRAAALFEGWEVALQGEMPPVDETEHEARP